MTFRLGLIEGFYGRQWNWDQREALPALLSNWGYQSYLYAPKGDSSLRSAWHQPLGKVHSYRLRALGQTCKSQHLEWGVGFSPAGLQSRFERSDRQRLATKLEELKALELDCLWVLFDDLPAGHRDLARRQLEVVDFIRQRLPVQRMAVCPSYYSEDPILEELFGKCPPDYFHELAAGLSQDIEILWTGRQVISAEYSQQDVERARLLLGRKPLLWDNYPVNDGRKSSRYLNLYPFRGRPWQLEEWSVGHFVNPMNQFEASCMVLPSLPRRYRDRDDYRPEAVFQELLRTLPAALAGRLAEDWAGFQERGLDELTAAEKSQLQQAYRQIDHPLAREVTAWLAEEYRFDPDCLTE